MGYVIIPKPHFSSCEVILAILTGRGHLCDLSRKAPPGGCSCRRSDWSVALNHDHTYRRRWVIQVNSSAGDSVSR